MESFKRFHKEKIESVNNQNLKDEDTRLLTKFFHLNKTYLSFMDYNDDNSYNGINSENYLMVNSSTGKSKVSIQDYLKFLEILNPNFAVMPFEYVSLNIFDYYFIIFYIKLNRFKGFLVIKEFREAIPRFWNFLSFII
jgi:hypothetical protein